MHSDFISHSVCTRAEQKGQSQQREKGFVCLNCKVKEEDVLEQEASRLAVESGQWLQYNKVDFHLLARFARMRVGDNA